MQEVLTYIFIAAAAAFIILTFIRKVRGKQKDDCPKNDNCANCQEYDCKLRNQCFNKDNNCNN